MIPALILLACSPEDDADTGETEDPGLQVADIASPSSGECPDLSGGSGTFTFLSSGEERTATVLVPEGIAPGAPLVFFFHGLMGSGHADPTDLMAEYLELQDVADETGAIIVLPESRIMEMFTYSFYMWEIFEQDDLDLVFYDDLRACVATDLEADLDRLPVLGFSGGALFTTVLLRERGDTVSAAVEMSGGSDLDHSMLPDIGSAYGTPPWTIPTLLWAGGGEDVWPDPELVVVDFEAATDSLQGQLVTDGHFVVRCGHEFGHTITTKEFNSAQQWALAHSFAAASPYEGTDVTELANSCVIAE